MDEILKAIKTALKKVKVDEKHAERVQKLFKIEKAEDIDGFVTLFKENVLPAIDEAGKSADETAAKKAVAEYEKKHNLKDGKTIETQIENPENMTDMTPEMKALFEAQQKSIKELTELVGGVVRTTTSAQRLADVKGKLKGKVDDKFIERVAGKVNLDAEDMDAEIEAQVLEHNEYKQSLIDEYVGGNYVPASGKEPQKSEKEWAEFMNADADEDKVGVVDLGL